MDQNNDSECRSRNSQDLKQDKRRKHDLALCIGTFVAYRPKLCPFVHWEGKLILAKIGDAADAL